MRSVAGSWPDLAQRGDDVGEARRVDGGHVEVHRGSAGLDEQAVDRARDGVARLQLVDEPLAGDVVQRGALAAHGLRDEEALAPGDPDDRGRVELDELEVGEVGARGAREQQARSVGAGRVGRARPQRRGAARGQDHGARGDDAPVVAGDRADAPVVARQQRPHAAALEHVDALLLDHVGRQLAQDPPPRGAAARVDDPADPVAALEPEREVAVAIRVEAHAERLEVGEARGRLLAQHLRGRAPHEAASGRHRVLQVQRGRVVRGERRGEAALRPVGGGLGERPRGHERHASALARGRQRREQPGRAGADHDEIARRLGHRPVRYRACRRNGSAMTPGSRTTSRATRSGPRGSWRSRPRWSATTGSAGSAPRRRGRRATSCRACMRSSTST